MGRLHDRGFHSPVNSCPGENMLYSESSDIGFAHYPKTAGHSLAQWFREVFPDARLVETQPRHSVSHLAVSDSLERLGLVKGRIAQPWKNRRGLARVYAKISYRFSAARTPCATRIIGVVREPFEMLVSLYEYWRNYAFEAEPTQPLIQSARRGTFREFLVLAVVERGLPNYHDFYDMSGPAAATTRLLDFRSLEPALRQVCQEFQIDAPPTRLGILNAGARAKRRLEPYLTAGGSLVADVRSHFAWYYTAGIEQLVTGAQAGSSGVEPG